VNEESDQTGDADDGRPEEGGTEAGAETGPDAGGAEAAGAEAVSVASEESGETGGAPKESVASRLRRWLAFWSLARLARWRARREEGHAWPTTILLSRWRWVRAHWRDRSYYLLIVVWIGLIFVPFPNDWNPFGTAEEAEGFLKTLWQVDAAALALSLAIIVFAVQAYRSANQERYGALRRYIRAAWLQEGYEQGVVALLITGVVLLGAGHGGVAGSAGSVAGFACLLSIFVLPPLLNGALRTSRRDFLQEEREARLTGAVSEQVDREVEALHGTALLAELAATEPMLLDPYAVARPAQPMNAVIARMVGSVPDINLRRLIHLARTTRDGGGVTMTTRLYDFVGPESKLLLIPAAASADDTKLAGRVVKLKPGRWQDEALREYLKDLEEEAIAAIRTGAPGTFDSIGDAYVATLMEFPRSWARYGHEYSVAVARGSEFFPVGPVNTIRQQFYGNIVEALRGTSDEVMLSAAYLPIKVCTSALEYRADGLFAVMIGLSTTFVAAGWAHGGDKGNLLARQMPSHLVGFTRFNLQPHLEQGEIAERLRFGGYVRLVYDQFGTILKLGVDRGEIGYIRSVDGDWDTLLEHWNVDAYSSHPTVLQRLEEEVSSGEPGAAERLEEARTSAQLAELSEELSDRRTILRFGLALWAWRQQPKSWRESFTYFTAQLGGLGGLVNVTTKAVDVEFQDRAGAPWSDWILGTLQTFRAHVIGPNDAAMQTFVGAALRAINPEEPAPQLPSAEWMDQYLDQLRNLLTAAVTDDRNEDLPDVAERAIRLREALEAAAEAWRQQERQTTIEEPLVPEKVTGFCEQARVALAHSRVVPDLLRLAGAVTELTAPPDDQPLINSQASKNFFTADGRFVGLDMMARDIGNSVAHLELSTLIQPMTDAEPRLLVTDDAGAGDAAEFVEQLRPIVAGAVQAATPTAVVVLVPIGWQLAEAMGLAFLGGGPSPPEEWRVSEGTTHNYAGVFEGAAAYHFPEVPSDVLYVVDLSRYATAETWPLSDDAAVTVTEISEADARERAEQDPGKDELGEEEIVRRWREIALVTVDPGLRISGERDAAALTAIRLPTSLQRD
jgi:hypothetical protein